MLGPLPFVHGHPPSSQLPHHCQRRRHLLPAPPVPAPPPGGPSPLGSIQLFPASGVARSIPCPLSCAQRQAACQARASRCDRSPRYNARQYTAALPPLPLQEGVSECKNPRDEFAASCSSAPGHPLLTQHRSAAVKTNSPQLAMSRARRQSQSKLNRASAPCHPPREKRPDRHRASRSARIRRLIRGWQTCRLSSTVSMRTAAAASSKASCGCC